MCYHKSMKSEIVKFIKEVCEEYNLHAVYIPDVESSNDLYSLVTKQGYVIMSFTTDIFYHISPRERKRNFLPAIKRGLNLLVGERSIKKNRQLDQQKRLGKIIV